MASTMNKWEELKSTLYQLRTLLQCLRVHRVFLVVFVDASIVDVLSRFN